VTTRTLVVVTAGLTQPSSTRLLADRLAAATRDELTRLGIEASTDTIHLREYGRDVMNNLLTGFPSTRLGAVVDKVRAADGLIAVTPIFNASYSGLFKSFFDVLEPDSLVDQPVLIAATGGTARHSLALEHAVRPLLVYLHAVVMPTSVYAAPEDWAGGSGPDGGWSIVDPSGDPARVERARAIEVAVPGPADPPLVGGPAPLHSRIERAVGELAAAMARREPRAPADPFALTTPFEDLIAGP
jgi:FMN reductase